jgi:hypothetical protein
VFCVMITVRCREQEPTCSQFCFVHFACEVVGKIPFLLHYFFIFFINISKNIFFLQATVLGCESSLMELYVEMHVWIDDHKKKVQQLVDGLMVY